MSDHIPLTVTIPIVEEYIQTKKQMIIKDSDEEKMLIKELIKSISSINTSDLLNIILLKNAVLTLACSMKRIWEENLKIINITKHSKSW